MTTGERAVVKKRNIYLRNKRYREKNKEKVNAWAREYKRKNKKKLADRAKELRDKRRAEIVRSGRAKKLRLSERYKDDLKWCSKCQAFLAINLFGKRKNTFDGLDYWCKSCSNANAKIVRKNTNPDIARQYRKEYQEKNRERIKLKRRLDRPKLLESSRKRLYGVTTEETNQMLVSQNGVCAICLLVPNRPCVDHCHKSGKFRGILCSSCNRGLGFFHDNVEYLKSAIDYLGR